MRVPWILSLVMLSSLGSGCSMYHQLCRVLRRTPCDQVDDCKTQAYHRQEADKAWAQFQSRCATPYSCDFEQGFKDGFFDFVQRDGTGMPPTMPPWRYRHLRDENPEGFAAIRDWDAGFVEGANAARASGLRQFYVVPTPAYLMGASVTGPLPPLSVPGDASELPPPSTLPAEPVPTAVKGGRPADTVDSATRRIADWVR